MAHQLTIRRILKRDWPALGMVIAIGLIWIVAAVLYLIAARNPADKEGRGLSVAFCGISLLVTVICGAVAVWRIHSIRQVFARGEVIQGRVAYVGENAEVIGYAVIVYSYNGRKYKVNQVTEGAPGRGGLTQDDDVDLVVDPRKPSRAYVAKVYLE